MRLLNYPWRVMFLLASFFISISSIGYGQCNDVVIVDFTATGSCNGCTALPACVQTSVTVDNSDNACCVGPNNPNSSNCKQLNIDTGDLIATCFNIVGTPQDNGANWWMVDGSSGDCGTLVELGGGTEINLDIYDAGGIVELIICKQGSGEMVLDLCAIPCCEINGIDIPDQDYLCYEDVPEPTTVDEFLAMGGTIDLNDLVGDNGCDEMIFTYTDYSIPSEICVDKQFQRLYEVCFCGDQNFSVTQTITISADNLPPTLEVDGSTTDFATVDFGCVTEVPTLTPELPITAVSDDCSTVDLNSAIITDDSPGVDLGSCQFLITRSYSITDACDSEALITETWTYTLNENPPTFDLVPFNVSFSCIDDVPAAVDLSWSDDCDGTGTTPVNETIGTMDPCTGGMITREWSYTDQCGLGVTHTQIITIIPETGLTFSTLPADITISCNDPIPDPIDLTYTNSASNPSCEESGTVSPVDNGTLTICGDMMTRTWDFTSACGEQVTHTQNITLLDDTAPVLQNPPGDVTVACASDLPPIPNIIWNDDCDGTGSAIVTETPNLNGCNGGTVERLISYTDNCGNTIEHSQIIVVSPYPDVSWISSLPTDLTVLCGQTIPSSPDLDYSNGMDGTDCLVSGTISYVDSGILNQCGDQITRTWTLAGDPDNCIIELTHTITITLDDDGMPNFINLPPTSVNVSCVSEIPTTQDLEWEDDCDGTGTIGYTDDGTPDPCNGGNITRTWTFTDNCGNGPISFSQLYIIQGTPFTSCDDGDSCTENDMEKLDCDGNVCVPCQGTPTDCSGEINYVTCDDNNPCTENDQEGLACDGTVCEPCQGTTPETCIGAVPNEVLPCDDGDPCTINDVYEVDGCDLTTECVPCQGTYNPTPDPTPSTSSIGCMDETTTISLTGCGGTVTWYDAPGGTLLHIGDTFTTPVLTADISYYVSCTIDGCESNAVEMPVTVVTATQVNISGPNELCVDQESITITADSGYDSYNWGTGAGTNPSFDVSQAGTYSVTATDSNGCTSETSFTVNAATIPNISIAGSTAFCIGGSTTLNVPTGFTDYSWGPNGETSNSINVSAVGTYTVTVTNASGCTGEASIDVIEADGLMPVISGDLSFCEGESTDISVGSGYASINWAPTGESTETITVNTAQSYSVTVSDADGCTGIATVDITEDPNPTPSISGDMIICNNGTGMISVDGTYTSYEWGDGSINQDLNITSPGTYSVTVVDGNGCFGTTNFVVDAAPDPIVDVTGDLLLCPGGFDITTLTATGGFASYVWSNGGSTSNTLDVTETGTYTVTVTDANGCEGEASVNVTLDTPPVVNIDGNLQFCSGFSTTLTATSGLSNYEWSTGANSESIDADSPGSYSVTVTDADGCTNEATVTVSELSELMPEIIGNLDICPGGVENVTLTLSGSFEIYDWGSGPGTDNSLTVNTAGTYSVTVTDANGCSGNTTVTIVENTVDEITITGGPTFCAGTTLDLIAGGNFDTYIWSNGISSANVTVNSSGTYTVTATDSNGCTNTSEIEIIEIPDPPVSIDGDFTLCPDGVDMVTLIATSGYTNYQWSNNESGSNEITIGTAGSYTVTVTDENGCTNTANVDVIEDTPPDVAIDGNLVFCTGFSTTLTATAGLDAYIWNTGATSNQIDADVTGTFTVTVTDTDGCTNTASIEITELSELMPNITGDLDICPGQYEEVVLGVDGSYVTYEWGSDGTGNDPTITINQAGTYSVTVTDSNGCSGNSTITVTENEVDEVTITGGPSFCAGTTLNIIAGGNFDSYEWSNGNNLPSIGVSSPGTYTVTATDSNGCTNTAEIEITEIPDPPVSIDGDFTLCPDGLDMVTLIATDGYQNYEWSNNESGSNETTVGTPGTYTVTVTDENGCTNTANVEVTEDTPPEVTIDGDLEFCTGFSSTLTATDGLESYEWSTGDTTNQTEATESGTYTVTVTDSNGCTNTASIEITELSELMPNITGDLDICPGQYEEVILGVDGSYETYEWGSDGTGNNPTLTINQAGTYSVTVTDSNGCSGNSTITVTENEVGDVSIAGPESFCAGTSTGISATAGWTSYEWSDGSTGFFNELDEPGLYSVTVTDENGCTNSAEFNLIETEIPMPEITGDFDLCEGDSETIDIGTWTDIIWSTGDTGNTIDVNTAGDYTATVTDENGCTNTATVTIIVNPLPTPTLSGDLSFCIAGSTTINLDGSYSDVIWSTGDTGNSIEVNTFEEFTVTVTDENGCTNSASVTTELQDGLFPEIMGPDLVCLGSTIELDAGDYLSYLWDDGSTINPLEVTGAGTYSVTVTDAGDCTGVASYTVAEAEPEPVEINGNEWFCAGLSVELTASGNHVGYEWSTGETSATIEVNEVGIYSVTATDANGCTASNEIEIIEQPNPEPTIEGVLQFCIDEETTIGVVEDYVSYEWSTGETTQDISVGEVGTYTVTVTDENGCTGTQEAEVTEFPPLDPRISGLLVFCIDGFTEIYADPGYVSYEWNTGETTESINVGTEGVYSVTVTDEFGCTGETSAEVIEQDQLYPEITSTGMFCEGGQGILSAGADYAEYQWDDPNNSTTPTIIVEEGGVYNVTVTDAYGCTGTATHGIVEVPSPEIEITGNVALCEGESTELFATEGFDTYIWSPSGDQESIEVDEEGTYSVTAFDENGCSATTSIYVEIFQNPEPELWGLDIVCFGYTNTFEVVQNFESYEWSTGETTQSIEYGDTDIVYVTVTDENGCIGTGEISQDMYEINEAEIAGSPTFCEGGTTTLDAGLWISYEWEGPIFGDDQFLEVNIEGEYTVYVTDYNGCTSSSSVYVEEGNELYPNITGNFEFCTGGSAMLNAGVFDSYEWSGPESGNEQVLEVTTPGTYTLTVTQGSCIGEIEFEVEELISPELAIEGITSICSGQATVLSVDSFNAIEWSTGATAESISVNQAGTYSVTVTGDNGCTSESSVIVIEAEEPNIIISGDGFFCTGGSTNLLVGEFDNYTWSTGETTQSIVVSTPGNYSITVTDNGGCTGVGSIEVIELNEEPLIISGSTTFCVGSFTVIDAGSGYVDYLWSNGETTQSIMIEDAGIYTVTVTTNGGCILNESITITEETSLTFDILGESNICEGSTTILDAGSFSSYVWDTPEGPFNTQTIEVSSPGVYTVMVDDGNGCTGEGTIELFIVETIDPVIEGVTTLCEGAESNIEVIGNYDSYSWSNGSTESNITVSNPGTYSVTVTTSEGCELTTETTVENEDSPVPVILGQTTFCPGSTVILDAGEFESYQWSIPGATNQTLEIGIAGEVSVTVTDVNGCEGVATTTLTNNEIENPQIAGSTSFCTNSSTSIELLGTWSEIIWNTNETNNVIEIDTEGTYSVTVTDELGCTSMTSITIIEDNNLSVNVLADTDIICDGSISNLSAGNFFESYEWSTGESSSDIEVTQEGTYTVTVSDAGGCTGIGTIDVNDGSFELPEQVNPYTICGDEQVQLGIDNNFTQYDWSTGEETQYILVSEPGIYMITVTNALGCEATSEFTVVENEIEPVQIEGNLQICEATSSILTVDGYETYQWSVAGETSNTLEINSAGTYSVTVTNEAGCEAIGSINIINYPTSSLVIAGSTSFCVGSSTTLSLSELWTDVTWSNGELGNVATFNEAGTVSVTATDINGCVYTAETDLSEDTELSPNIIGDSYICESEIVILDAGVGYGFYEWSTGESSQTIEVTEPGIYTVNVIDQSGVCSGEGSFEVSESIIETPIIDGPTTACPSESIILSVEDIYATYEWSTGSQESSTTVTGGGEYSLTVYNAEGCSTSTIISIENEETPEYEITNISCSEDGEEYTVIITTDALMVTNDLGLNNEEIGPGQYQISGIPDMQLINITISNGITFCSENIEIIPPNCECQAIANAGLDQTLNCQASMAILNGNDSSMGPEFSYEWIDPNGQTISTDLTAMATIGGLYTLIVTDNVLECSVTDQVFVDATTLPQPEIDGIDAICDGDESILSVDQTFETYNWSTGENTQSITVLTGGIFELTVTDSEGCEGIAIFEVEQIDIPNIQLMDRFCNDNADHYTIQFLTDAENIEIDLSNTIIDLGNDLYEISEIDINESITISASNSELNCNETLAVNPPNCFCEVTADAGQPAMITCVVESVIIGGELTSTGDDIELSWYNENGEIISNEQYVEVTEAGIYTLEVFDLIEECSDINTVEVSLSTDIPSPIINGMDIICLEDETILTLNQTYSTYNWSNGAITESIIVNQSGTYDVTVTNMDGCEGIGSFSVDVIESPIALVTDKYCNDDANNYTIVLLTEADNVEVDVTNTVENLGNGTYQISDIDINLSVNVTISYDNLDCNNTISIAPPNCFCEVTADAGEPGMLTCEIESVTLGGEFTTTGNNIEIVWYDQNGEIISNDQYIDVNEPGIYTLEVFDLDEACSDISSVEVSDEAGEPIAIILSNTDNIIDCQLASVELYVNPEDNTTYVWTTNSGNEMNGTSINVDNDGEVVLMAIDTITGCSSVDTIMIEDMSEYPAISLDDPMPLDCNNTEVLIGSTVQEIGNDILIEWYNEDNETITVLNDSLQTSEPGWYYIQATDLVNGCTNIDSVQVIDNIFQPEIEAGEDMLIPCDQTGLTLEALNVSIDSDRDFEYEWTTEIGNIVEGSTNLNPIVNQEGTYYIQITDVLSGCVATDSIYIDSDENKPYGVLTEVEDPFCSNESSGSINIEGILGGDGPYNFTLNGEEANQDGYFDNLQSGMYELFIEDMNGCVHDTLIEISFENEISLTASPPVIELEENGSEPVQLLTNLEESEISSLEWNQTTGVSCTDCLDPIISSNVNTEYQITIFDEFGCSDTTTIRVLVEVEALADAPQIITPTNDDDLKNQRFTIYTHPNVEIIEELHIYDRWGELMFSNFDFQPNRPSLGWNGKFKGEYVVPGVYVYIATYRTKWGETGIIKGDVTIAL